MNSKPVRFRFLILAALACLVLPAAPAAAGDDDGDDDAPTTAGARAAAAAPHRGAVTERGARLEAKAAKKRKKPFDKPAEAQAWYLRQRTHGAPLDYSRIAAAKEQAARMAPRNAGDILAWRELGPGNIGGRTRALLIDPANANSIFAAGVAGGVWKTGDGGATWQKLDDLMANLAVCTLAFERTNATTANTQVIYAGTGEGYYNGDAVRGAGIFKSTNGGASWKQLPATATSDFHYVNKIVTSAFAPQTVYAATRTGVWRSTNGGGAWTRVLNNNGSGGAGGTLADTQSSDGGMMDLAGRTDLTTDVLLATSGQFVDDGIYRSLDGGNTWARTQSGLGRTSLAIAPSNQATMYACAADTTFNRLQQVYRSTDGGATWTGRIAGSYSRTNKNWLLLTNPIIANLDTCLYPDPADEYHQGWYDNVIAVAPHNADVVYAGGIDLFRSDDGAANWTAVSYWWVYPTDPGYNHADQHAIVFHPQWNGTSNQTLFSGNDGGIYKCTNGMGALGTGTLGGICYETPPAATTSSLVWTSLNNGYNVTQFYHGRAYPASATYLGGTQDNGTPRGSDGGGVNGWTDISGGDGGYVFVNPSNTNKLFVEYTGKSIYRSTDGGMNFASATGSLTESDANFPFIAPFRADPQNPERIWYGGLAPWRTSNASSAATAAGITWTQAGAAFSGGDSITAWAISPNNSNLVWAGTANGKIFRSTAATTSNSGTAWTAVSSGLPAGGFISWIEVDPNDATGNTVYATQSEFGLNKVFRTTTGGSGGWTNITANLPDIPAHCIVVRPGAASTLYLGTDLGVFRSKNTGASWASMNNGGFANVPVEALEFQNASTLYAFTHGRGAWRATLDITGGNELTSVSTDTLSSSANWVEYLREPAAGDASYGGLTALDHDAGNTAIRARIYADPGTAGLPLFRAAGWRATDAYSLSAMPYSSVGTGNIVRSKWYVYTTDPDPTTVNRIPAVRMQLHNRFVVSTTLEVFSHQNDGANNAIAVTGDELGSEVAPSSNPAQPSLYRVDFDPIDVPYLVTNGATEGIGRAFLAQGDLPQDKGFIAVTESVIGVYPSGLLTTPTLQTLQATASDAGSLKVSGVTPAGGVGGPAILRFTYPFGLTGRIQNADFGTYPDYSQGSFGVTMDSATYNNLPDGSGNATRAGIVLLGFYPGDNLAQRPRVEPGKQYKIRFHVTSTNQSNLQCQMRLQVNIGGGVYAQKLELGGSVTGSTQRQTIAAQAMPGVGTQNPDKYPLEDRGGWYTLLMYTPLSKAVRPDVAGTLAARMPNWFTFAGPGVNDLATAYGGSPGTPGALNRRDLRLFAALLDTLSFGSNSGILEKGNFTIDRIDVFSADAVDDGSPETTP